MTGTDNIDRTTSHSVPAKPALLPADAFSRNNAISVFLIGALPAVAGSAISFLLGIFFIWGLISLLFRRFEFRMTRSDRILAWTFTTFAVLVLATGLMGENPLLALRSVWLLPFLSLWVIIPRLRATPDIDYLRFFIAGATAGAIGAMVFSLVEMVLLGLSRPEGGAGNAIVFATMALCLAGVAGLNVDAQAQRARRLAGAAIAAGLIAVALSLARGVALAAIVVAIVMIAYAPRKWLSFIMTPRMLLLPVAAAIVLYAGWDHLEARMLRTFIELGQLQDSGHSTSIGERLRLWSAAWQATLDSPIWGHGIQNRMEALVPYLRQDGFSVLRYTHAHNGFLSVMVDGGIIVLAALLALLAMPIVVAARAPRDDLYRRRLFLALIVVTTYVSCGMTQILFKHDIMDSFYIFTVIVIAASVRERA